MKEPSARRQKSVGGLSASGPMISAGLTDEPAAVRRTSLGEDGGKAVRAMRILALVCGLLTAGGILAGGCALAGASKDKKMTKISRDLVALYDEYMLYQHKREGAAFTPSNSVVHVSGEHVMIDAVASGDAAALRADLEGLGLLKAAAFGRMVSGSLPIEAIDDLAALASLQFVRPAYAQTHSGSRQPGGLQRPVVRPLDQK